MISEASFAKRFTSFWNELLPNAKNYVRLANSAARVATHRPLPAPDRRHNTAFVNTLAFNLYRRITTAKQDYRVLLDKDFLRSPALTEEIELSARYLHRFRDYTPHELPISDAEWQQTIQIARIISDRYSYTLDPVIAPSFDGCGFLNPAEGDLLVGNTLVEIKSGERSFSLVDFRQILVYCALNHLGKVRADIRHVELFNPRMGILFSDTVEGFSIGMSSLGSLELFAELGAYLSNTNFSELPDES